MSEPLRGRSWGDHVDEVAEAWRALIAAMPRGCLVDRRALRLDDGRWVSHARRRGASARGVGWLEASGDDERAAVSALTHRFRQLAEVEP